ncbi:MAG: agmatinase [Sulfolobales archaeon]
MAYKELYLNSKPMVFGGYLWPREKTFVSFVGVPFDSTVTYKPGSRFGPDHVRIASRNIELYSLRNQVDVEEFGIYDEGDIITIIGDVEKTLDRIEKVVKELISENRLYIFVGGEHTITYGIIRGVYRKKLGVVIFDAHLDLRNDYLGLKYSHATVMKRVSEILGAGSLFYIGTRAISKEELSEVSKLGHEYISIYTVRKLGLREVIKRFLRWSENFSNFHISIDVDVLDPSVAPGVTTPEPEGLNSWELLELINELINNKVISVDIVEYNPLNDPSEITAMLISKIIVEITAKYLITRSK